VAFSAQPTMKMSGGLAFSPPPGAVPLHQDGKLYSIPSATIHAAWNGGHATRNSACWRRRAGGRPSFRAFGNRAVTYRQHRRRVNQRQWGLGLQAGGGLVHFCADLGGRAWAAWCHEGGVLLPEPSTRGTICAFTLGERDMYENASRRGPS